jgi:peptidoglycan hydrolase-like protein with peptidoglycan-binding domain
MRPGFLLCLLVTGLVAGATPSAGWCLTARDVNSAEFESKQPKGLSPLLVKLQVLLDRARFSPGVIDGLWGENVEKALAAFAKANGIPHSGELNEKVWSTLSSTSSEPPLAEYEISHHDVSGPFNPQLPTKLEEMARLKELPFRNPRERLAEKFHMDEDLLAALNPDADFTRSGTRISVARLGKPTNSKARRVEVDKRAMTVRAFGEGDRLLAFYPATAGSDEKPAPSGTLKVVSVAENPTYIYDPGFAFKGVKATEPFSLPGGPNSPVGSIWIELSVAQRIPRRPLCSRRSRPKRSVARRLRGEARQKACTPGRESLAWAPRRIGALAAPKPQ